MLLVHSWEGLLAIWGICPYSSTCLEGVEASDVCSHCPGFLFLLSLLSLLLAQSLLFFLGTVCISVQKTEIHCKTRWDNHPTSLK